EAVFSTSEQPWLGDHRVGEQVSVPGAGLVEMARAAAEHGLGAEQIEVISFVVQQPLVIPETGPQRVQTVLTDVAGQMQARIYSQPANAPASTEWTLHASGEVKLAAGLAPAPLDLDALRARCNAHADVAAFYEAYAAAGILYGSTFQGVRTLSR